MHMLNQHRKKINERQFKEIDQSLHMVEKERVYKYPWLNIENDLQSMKLNELTFIGYGSILNSKSCALTFPDLNHETFKPVIAFGTKRIFNYRMPEKILRYGHSNNPINLAALNVRYTGKKDDLINGILVKLPINLISNFRDREIGYDLIPIVYTDWNNNRLCKTYILRCPDEIRDGKKRTNYSIKPHLYYYDVCRSGAESLGKDFLDFWLNTTYLADGKTSVSEWETK